MAPVGDTVSKLDAWENRWFPVTSAMLERRFPAVHAMVFKNLSQTSGPAVVVGVQTFIDRIEQMAAGAGGYGADGTAAFAVLEARGLTKAVVDEARELLHAVARVAPSESATTIEADKEALAKAEGALWAWYLEWSQIARVAIRQRVLLRQMGFVNGRARSAVDEDEPVDEDEQASPSNGSAHP